MDKGERAIVEKFIHQMDVNGTRLSGSVISHEMGEVGRRSDP